VKSLMVYPDHLSKIGHLVSKIKKNPLPPGDDRMLPKKMK
jgi:hypothetical protein